MKREKRIVNILYFIIFFFNIDSISVYAGNSIVNVDINGVGQYTSIALNQFGNPVISYYDAVKTKLKIVTCFDKNCAFFNAILLPDPVLQTGKYTSLALDKNNNPVISYYDQNLSKLKILHCGNFVCSVGNTIAVPDGIGVGQYTSVTVDGNNKPVVSYYDVTKGKLKILYCGNPSCTSGNSIVTPDMASSNGVQSSIKLDALGHPIVTYFDFTNKSLKILYCGNNQCTSGNTIKTLDASGDVGRYPSLILDTNGKPVISYLDLTQGKLKILHCGNQQCSSGNIIVYPDNHSIVGYFSSLRLDGSGHPVVSYYDLSNKQLKLLHCGDNNCKTANTIVIPDSNKVGFYTSLALDIAGNPVVSYYDELNGNLKVLHCDSTTCGTNTMAVPDTSNAGQYSSIKLDANGDPVVSYWDETNGVLKLLHCGDNACSNNNSIATVDGIPTTGWDTSLQLDTNGNPVVSYYNFSAGKMSLLHCSDNNCTGIKTINQPDVLSKRHTSLALDVANHPVIASAGQPDQGLRIVHCTDNHCLANASITSPDFPAFPFQADIRGTSLVLDKNGHPVVSFYRADKKQLKVLHCLDTLCAAQNNSIAIPDPTAQAPSHRSTSITLDMNGFPVLAYHDAVANALKILHCGDINCTTANNVKLAVVGAGIELDPSIQLDANGFPVVSYSADSGLQLLHCGDANCGVGNIITSVDPSGAIADSSLVLDANGNPVISYYLFSSKKLKVVHCATPSCQ